MREPSQNDTIDRSEASTWSGMVPRIAAETFRQRDTAFMHVDVRIVHVYIRNHIAFGMVRNNAVEPQLRLN